jgi:hypothetical protein
MRRVMIVLVLLVLAGCSIVRERWCVSQGGWINAPDVCRFPSNTFQCPMGFSARDEHDYYVDCAHVP